MRKQVAEAYEFFTLLYRIYVIDYQYICLQSALQHIPILVQIYLWHWAVTTWTETRKYHAELYKALNIFFTYSSTYLPSCIKCAKRYKYLVCTMYYVGRQIKTFTHTQEKPIRLQCIIRQSDNSNVQPILPNP